MNPVSIVSVLVLLAASLSLGGASSSTARNGDALLASAMAAPSTVSYTGLVEVVRIGSRTSDVSVYRIEHRAPDLTRRIYSAPSDLAGDWVLAKGALIFSVDVKRQRIVVEKNDAVDDRPALKDNYQLLLSNYAPQREGNETFDGRPAAVVLLVSKYTHRPAMRMRVDRQSSLVLDKQEFATDGSLVSETRFESVQYASDIPPSDFTLPKQYTIVQGPTFGEPSQSPDAIVRGAGFAAREPKSLPEGFAPVEGNLIEMKGVRTIHLLYSDGIRTVSLFENAGPSAVDMNGLHPQSTDIAGHEAQYAQDGATALLAWTDGDLHCELVGELGREELQRIAASIAP
jgi:negative regulator of sigma E activity